MIDQTLRTVTLRDLWRQFLPLSVSDITMAASDPLITTTLARLPHPTVNLAAIGVAKAITIFFESPVIMLLHASNALAPTAESRLALRRFMLLACAVITIAMGVISLPWVFDGFARTILGLETSLIGPARQALLFLLLWPAVIGWRRYHQGLLIRYGQARAMARAGMTRIGIVGLILVLASFCDLSGVQVAGMALICGVMGESIFVTIAAHGSGATKPPEQLFRADLPRDLRGVWKFYWPLANSMLVVWGGRAVLLAIIARSMDASLALAAWPAAWGLTLVVANATRMVQQVVIKNRGIAADRLLMRFALSLGLAYAIFLVVVGATPAGILIIRAFVGQNDALVASIQPVILTCASAPLFVSLQNAAQGFLIGDGKTGRINVATWIGTVTLLCTALVAIRAGLPGATAAAIAMTTALLCETCFLALLAKLWRLRLGRSDAQAASSPVP